MHMNMNRFLQKIISAFFINHFGISVVVCVVCSSGMPYGGSGPPSVVDETSSTH